MKTLSHPYMLPRYNDLISVPARPETSTKGWNIQVQQAFFRRENDHLGTSIGKSLGYGNCEGFQSVGNGNCQSPKPMKKNIFVAENGILFLESFHGVVDPSLPEFSVNGVHLQSKSTTRIPKKNI